MKFEEFLKEFVNEPQECMDEAKKKFKTDDEVIVARVENTIMGFVGTDIPYNDPELLDTYVVHLETVDGKKYYFVTSGIPGELEEAIEDLDGVVVCDEFVILPESAINRLDPAPEFMDEWLAKKVKPYKLELDIGNRKGKLGDWEFDINEDTLWPISNAYNNYVLEYIDYDGLLEDWLEDHWESEDIDWYVVHTKSHGYGEAIVKDDKGKRYRLQVHWDQTGNDFFGGTSAEIIEEVDEDEN